MTCPTSAWRRAVPPVIWTFIITVSPTGEATHKLDSHEGEEWLYGMEGETEIEYGNETYVLGPGESIYYDFHRAPPGKSAQWTKC